MAALDSPTASWTDSPAVFWADVPPFATWTCAAQSTMPLPMLGSPRPPTRLASCIPRWPPTRRQSLGTIAGDGFTSPLDAAQISQLVDIFLSRLHLSMPFFKRSYLSDNVRHGQHERDRQFNALLHSICAYTLFQPIVSEDRHLFSGRLKLAESVLSCSIALHGCRDFGQEPTIDTVITSFFLFGCQFCRGNHNAALVRLREAQVLAELLHLNDPSGYGNIMPGEFDRRVRTVTALIIIDRIYALQRATKLQMPRLMASEVMDLHSLINGASSPEEAPEDLAIEGIRQMIDSTDFVDDTVVRCWKNSCQMDPEEQHVTPERVTYLLARYMRPLRPTSATGTEAQHADILITRHWICSMLWTLSFHHGYTSFSASSKELQPSYAVHIAAETVEACSKFALSSLETHGVGLVEKLFEIAVNLTQVARAFELNMERTDGGNAISGSRSSAVLETESLDPTYVAPPSEELDWTAQLPNNFIDSRETQISHVMAILNRFLALLALFRGGNHPFLKPFVDIIATMNRPDLPGPPTAW
ncbi:hypothetical protein FOMG_18865 [Fusarium oxysporum f. sp. melonis 26406]|uniref:Transcription factor domain-containing protein n=1 Tax=Fusarium oxysporum f. sp. melonis 26406 TaxID=1089452 RepID=W9Z812_FUSOX|nr:hypothetical protein FOMG_18865 [Fusarium oxysporum f. sp. melonis 26406]